VHEVAVDVAEVERGVPSAAAVDAGVFGGIEVERRFQFAGADQGVVRLCFREVGG